MNILYFPKNVSNIFSVIFVFMQLSRSFRLCYTVTRNGFDHDMKKPG